MGPRAIWIGTGLVALVLAAVFTALRRPAQEKPELAEQAVPQAVAIPAPAPASPGSLASDLKQLPPGIREQVEAALRDAGAQKVQIAALDTRGRRGEGALQFLFTPPATNAPDWQRETWDKYMAPLMYPEGHPRAGQWRDSVSPEDVQAAAMPLAEKFYPVEYLDQPMLHVPEKRINFDELNLAASRLWNREDPSTAPGFYEWLKQAPEDPNAYASDFWLPAPAGHPDATSQREWISAEIKRQAAEQIAQQRAGAGS